jgi:hypothetical protein
MTSPIYLPPHNTTNKLAKNKNLFFFDLNTMNINILFVVLVCLLGLGQSLKIVVYQIKARKLVFK